MFFAKLADALEKPMHHLVLYVRYDGSLVYLLADLSAIPL